MLTTYKNEIAKAESRTPLFSYPYYIVLKSKKAEWLIASYFYKRKTSYFLGMREKDVAEMLSEENMKGLSGEYIFHYDDPLETEFERMNRVKHSAPVGLARRRIEGFEGYLPGTKFYGQHLIEGIDFEVVVGERVDIEQPEKLTFDDIPDLMGIDE